MAYTQPICMLQIRQSQKWRLGRVIRLFCNGMEVFDEQLLSELPCQVLHCTVTDGRMGACTCGKDEAAARQRCQGVRYPQLGLNSLHDFEASTPLSCKSHCATAGLITANASFTSSRIKVWRLCCMLVWHARLKSILGSLPFCCTAPSHTSHHAADSMLTVQVINCCH